MCQSPMPPPGLGKPKDAVAAIKETCDTPGRTTWPMTRWSVYILIWVQEKQLWKDGKVMENRRMKWMQRCKRAKWIRFQMSEKLDCKGMRHLKPNLSTRTQTITVSAKSSQVFRKARLKTWHMIWLICRLLWLIYDYYDESVDLYDLFFRKYELEIYEKKHRGEIHHSGPHGGWCNQCLCQQTSFTRSYLSHQGMINLPPFETLGAILAPGELLGLHNSTLSGCFLNTSTSRFCLRQGNGETWRNGMNRTASLHFLQNDL